MIGLRFTDQVVRWTRDGSSVEKLGGRWGVYVPPGNADLSSTYLSRR